jgi:hypothetical protein
MYVPPFMNIVYLLLVGITLGFSISWEKRKGKAFFVAFLLLFFAGYLISTVGRIALEMGVTFPGIGTDAGLYRMFAVLGWLFNLLALIPLLVFTIVSKTLNTASTTASVSDSGERAGPQTMKQNTPVIYPSKVLFTFPKKSAHEIQGLLREKLPSHTAVTVSDGKCTEIRIQDGLWRGAVLEITSDAEQSQVTRISYYIPSFLAKVIIFVTSVAAFSIIMSMVLTAVIGEFVPVFAGIGGMAGFAMYTIVKIIFIATIKNSWSVEVHQAIDTLRP